MTNIETITLPHLPGHPLNVALYKNVKNAQFLRQQLLEGNTDFEYAFLDATMILSRLHILAACFRAINDMINNRLKSRNVHSEIVFSLSPNNNIAESFRRFGISDTTQHVLAVKVRTASTITAESVGSHLQQNIDGIYIELTDVALSEFADVSKIKKTYKLNSAPTKGVTKHTFDGGSDRQDLESFVLGTMALKGS